MTNQESNDMLSIDDVMSLFKAAVKTGRISEPHTFMAELLAARAIFIAETDEDEGCDDDPDDDSGKVKVVIVCRRGEDDDQE